MSWVFYFAFLQDSICFLSWKKVFPSLNFFFLLMMYLWVFLSLSLSVKRAYVSHAQCPYNCRLHVITRDICTHTLLYLPNPQTITVTCVESQHISVVCIGIGTVGDSNHIYSWWVSICANTSCMQNKQDAKWGHPWVKWHLLNTHLRKLWRLIMSYNLWIFMSRSPSETVSCWLRCPFKGRLYNKDLPNNKSMCAHECNELRGLYNLQD